MASEKENEDNFAAHGSEADARRIDRFAGAADPRIAVVVLTYNRINSLLRTIDHLLHLPERPQIIVVDNGSADGSTQAVGSRFPMIKIIPLQRNIGAAGRNIGIETAGTPFIALCDDDTWWAPGSLKRAADLLEAYPRLAIITGRVLVGPEQRLDPTCARMVARPLPPNPALPGRAVLGFVSGACMIRKSAFLEIGGFEARLFVSGEEALVAADLYSAGWGLVYLDQLVAYHHPSRYRDAMARRRLAARNALWFAWLRRPAGGALKKSWEILRSAASDRVVAAGFVDALGGLKWVLQNRRVVPPHVEEALKWVEEQSDSHRGRGVLSLPRQLAQKIKRAAF